MDLIFIHLFIYPFATGLTMAAAIFYRSWLCAFALIPIMGVTMVTLVNYHGYLT